MAKRRTTMGRGAQLEPVPEPRMDAAAEALHRVTRCDRGEMREPMRTHEGYLVADAVIARPGVLVYRRSDGTERRELVPPETIADPEAMASLRRKPMTMEHPDRMLGPDSVDGHAIGDVSDDVHLDDQGRLVANVTIRSRRALDAIDAGMREVSAGYDVLDLDERPGRHPVWGPYDAVQRKRRYNHVAITEHGRAGPDVRMRIDSATEIPPGATVAPDRGTLPPKTDAPPQSAPRADSGGPVNPLVAALLALGVAEPAAKAAEPNLRAILEGQARKDADQLGGLLKKAHDDLKDASNQVKLYQSRLDALGHPAEEDVDPIKVEAAFMARHKARTRLERLAASVRLDAAEVDKLGDHGLRLAILKAARPDFSTDGRSAEVIAAAVDLLPEGNPAPSQPDPWAPRQDAVEPARRETSKKPAPVSTLTHYEEARAARLGRR